MHTRVRTHTLWRKKSLGLITRVHPAEVKTSTGNSLNSTKSSFPGGWQPRSRTAGLQIERPSGPDSLKFTWRCARVKASYCQWRLTWMSRNCPKNIIYSLFYGTGAPFTGGVGLCCCYHGRSTCGPDKQRARRAEPALSPQLALETGKSLTYNYTRWKPLESKIMPAAY